MGFLFLKLPPPPCAVLLVIVFYDLSTITDNFRDEFFRRGGSDQTGKIRISLHLCDFAATVAQSMRFHRHFLKHVAVLDSSFQSFLFVSAWFLDSARFKRCWLFAPVRTWDLYRGLFHHP